jgi:hypothetical protein
MYWWHRVEGKCWLRQCTGLAPRWLVLTNGATHTQDQVPTRLRVSVVFTHAASSP